MTTELGDTMMEREFESVDADGSKKTIKLKVGMPYQDTDTDSEVKWRCAYLILGKGSGKIRIAHGMDAIDAMLSAIQVAYIFLKSYKDTKITWLGDDELGLMLRSIKELTKDSENTLSNDENSPFKKAFDEFFYNFKSNHKS